MIPGHIGLKESCVRMAQKQRKGLTGVGVKCFREKIDSART